MASAAPSARVQNASVSRGEGGAILDARDRGEKSPFQARHRILPSAEDERDDSWRKKHHEIQEDFRKRKKREALAGKMATTKMGFLLLLVFCLVMAFVLYQNYEVRVSGEAPAAGSVRALVESDFRSAR